MIGSGWVSLPFAAVNVVGALVWGYGVHRYGMGRTIRRFLALCVLVALACTAVAAPIVVLVFDGTTGHGTDLTTATFQASLNQLAASALSANLLFSLVDKLLSGFLALAVLEAWTERRARPRDQAGEQTTTGISRSVHD
ncbi:MAG: hypothetical protein Q8Q02_16495 [Nocardioides sp.]|nr:hypothetical protein [Nocardioides sp.]